MLPAFILWGTGAGLITALVNVVSERYIGHGLIPLALEVAADGVGSCLLVALACWVVVAALHVVLSLLIKRVSVERARLRRAMSTARGAILLLVATLPVWTWSVWHDTWLYPRDLALLSYGLIGLAVVHVVGYLVLARPIGARISAGSARFARRAAGGCIILVLGLKLAHFLTAETPGPDAPNIVLVIMDTCRADRLSCYGYSKPTTPELDALACQGTTYSRCYATSCWTMPTHASLFTGLYPVRHRATQEHIKLARRFDTLAELLRNHGYQTFGASNNPSVSGFSWLDQGFKTFFEIWRSFYQRRYGGTGMHATNRAVEQFVRQADPDKPFFIFLNYMEAHAPYDPPEPFFSRHLAAGTDLQRARKIGRTKWTKYYCKDSPFGPEELAIASDLYDGGVAHVSHVVGELAEVLRRSGRFERTLLLVTSDHGESLGEHDHYEHEFNLHHTVLHVPLIIIDPDVPNSAGQPRVNSRTLQLTDLFASILDRAGVDLTGVHSHGTSIFANASRDSTAPSADRPVFAEYYFPARAMSLFDQADLIASSDRLLPLMRRLRLIQVDGKKLIWASRGQQEFYDVTADPAQLHNLFDDPPSREAIQELTARLSQLVSKYAEGHGVPPEPQITFGFADLGGLDRETRERLRTFGYIR